MVVVIARMVIIVLTAVAVLAAVYGMHLIARSPRARMKVRRLTIAAVANLYALRRQIAYRAQPLIARIKDGIDHEGRRDVDEPRRAAR